MSRLAFLLPGDPGTRTGGYIYDRRILHGLRVLGWTVDLVLLDEGFPNPSRAALDQARARLAALADNSLVLVDGLALGAMAESAASEARRLRLVGLVHHPLAEETGLGKDMSETLRDSERQALAAVAGVVATSAFTARLLTRAYGVHTERIAVVEPGTDPAPLARGSGSGALELLCVASLTRRKGHDILVEALAQLRDRPWHLTCVGSVRRSPETAAAIASSIDQFGLRDRISVIGEIDDASLADRYARADVFVLPTRFEGYGMALAEAVARGLPVVTTLGGAVPETIPRDAGIFVPPDDAGALAEALAQIIDRPERRSALAAGARAARTGLPTWEQSAARMAAALRGMRAR